MSHPTSPAIAVHAEDPPRKLNDAEVIAFVQQCAKSDTPVAVKVTFEVEGEVVQQRGIVMETTAKQFTWMRQLVPGGTPTEPAIKFGVSARSVFGLLVERSASGPSIADVLAHMRESQAQEASLSQGREDARLADLHRREDARATEAREFETKRLEAIAASDAKREAMEAKRLEDLAASDAKREAATAKQLEAIMASEAKREENEIKRIAATAEFEAKRAQAAEKQLEKISEQVGATGVMAAVIKDREDKQCVAVSTHAAKLQFSTHSENEELRLSLPQITLPPYNVGSSAGFTTQECIRHFDAIADETVRILGFATTEVGEDRREKLMSRLIADPEAKARTAPYRLRWIIENKLDVHSAFFIALESHILNSKFKTASLAANLRSKLYAGICAPANTTKESETWVVANGIKASNSQTKGVCFSLSYAYSNTIKPPTRVKVLL